MNNGFGVLGLFVSFGYMIYGLFNQKKSDRPEPQEVQCNSYVRNVPVPIVYGVNKVAGECIWLGNTRAEYVEPENGKGFGLFMPLFFSNKNQSENYGWFYYADFAIGLCEGPIKMLKIMFLNGNKLKNYWEYWDYSLYLGDGTQTIDPIVSEALDSDAVPWRYTANFVMSGCLGQANYVPTIEAEISGLLTGDDYDFDYVTILVQDFEPPPIYNQEGYFNIHRSPKQIDIDLNGDICCYQTNVYWPSGSSLKRHNKSIVSPLSEAEEVEYYLHTTMATNIQAFYAATYPGHSHRDKGSGIQCFQTETYIGFPNYYTQYYSSITWYRIWVHYVENPSGTFITNIYIGTLMSPSDTGSATICPVSRNYAKVLGNTLWKYLGNNKWLAEFYTQSMVSLRILLVQEYIYDPIRQDTGFVEIIPFSSKDFMRFLNHSDDTARDNDGNRLLYFFVNSWDGTPSVKIYRYSNGLGLDYLLTSPVYSTEPILIDYDEDNDKYYWVTLYGIYVYCYCQEDLLYSYVGCQGSETSLRMDTGVAIKNFHDYVFFALETGGVSGTGYHICKFLIYDKNNAQMLSVSPPSYVHPTYQQSYGGCSFFIENDKLYFLNHRNPAVGVGLYNYIWQVCLFNMYDDPNPIKVVYDFMTNERYGLGLSVSLFDGSPTTLGSWKTESDYCDENVEMEDGVLEKRFIFAETFNQRKKAYDLIREVLQTCRGFIYYCDGKIKVKIEKGTEEPVFYFGNDEYSFFTSADSSSKSTIVINDSTRPDNYWVGDIGYVYYVDGYGSMPYGVAGYGGTDILSGEISPLKSEFIITDSSSTLLTLYEALDYIVPEDTPITLIKDNMKKDSFQYSKKSEDDKINTIHLNYIERDDGNYRVDTLDLRNEYAIEQSGQIVEQSFDMYGIKRNTQARRMITFLDNFNSQINYECSFDTDLLGIMLCIGDIIGVTSDVMGWCGKLFRVSSMEEIEDLETKLTLLEYNSSIYSDDYIPAAESVYDLGEDFLDLPDNVLNLCVFEDSYVNKIWITFSRPVEYRFWIGAIIYHYDPNQSAWIKLDITNAYTFTGELSSSITSLSTTISFTSEYNSELLPSSGVIWIEEEMIYYGSIDEDTNSFLQCVRGYNDTIAAAHNSGEICTLFRSTLFGYNFDIKNDIDKTHSFKAVSLSSFGVLANTDNAPSVDIDIEGRYNDFYPVSLLNFYMSGNDIVLRWFGRTHNKNTGYGGMSYGAMGYGEGYITDVREYRMDIYVSSVFVKTKTIAIPDKTDDPYLHTYTEAENLADNGVLSYPLFIVYQVDNYGNLSSEQSIQSAA